MLALDGAACTVTVASLEEIDRAIPDSAKSTRATFRIWTPGAVACASDSVAEHKPSSSKIAAVQ